MGGIKQRDRICYQDIRQRLGIVAIADKLREARLRCHALSAEGDKVCRIGFDVDVPGKRPKGQAKQRWLDTLHADLKLARINPDQAHDRAIWRQRISKADPVRNGKNAGKEDSSSVQRKKLWLGSSQGNEDGEGLVSGIHCEEFTLIKTWLPYSPNFKLLDYLCRPP
ncbi:hypothetical protein ANCDUO_09119 [Ancylostoma duodenale]|uniref:Uncharacterized protein n=1 Tax=Ancylostoma duodenale TaxID=51022 RepID=A0A0C2DDT3_9BILA|nr:hypothetical protein ANCDUO_09119 [Ancylostoma duodenale]